LEARFNGELAKGEYKGKTLYLLKPQTFMNLSGDAVKKCMQFYKIKREDLLVVCDDVALDFGELRLKPGGSHGGHNGLRHIQQHLGSDYPRLRMGISTPNSKPLEDYVLEKFSAKEMDQLGALIKDATHVIKSWLCDGIDATMNHANRKKEDHK
jgi:PTH1 family peptidyl-tRNA hydrolase